MRIQNNITAMNTHRMYTINNNNVSRSAEKLSSGYRINRAGDDAAGLAISEKMRAQIRGLNMASKNSQDAVSLIQTAEGALQEVHSMLQRMNELANQASTGTNETFDRDQINAEFNQLKAEIDQIADTTTFNNMKLLDGSLASDAANVNVDAASKLQDGATLTSGTLGTNPGYTVTKHTGLSNQVGSYAIAEEGTGSGKIKITFTDKATGNETNTIIDLNKAVTGEVANGKSFTVDLSEAGLGVYTMTADKSAGTASISDLAAALATGDVTTTKAPATVTGTLAAPTDIAVKNTSGAGQHGAIEFELNEENIKSILANAGLEAGDYTLKFARSADNAAINLVASSDGRDTILGSVSTAGGSLIAGQSLTISSGGQTLATITEGSYTVGGSGSAATGEELEAALAAATGFGDLGTLTVGDPEAAATAKGGLKIQVGANEGDQLAISVAAMNTKGLKISNSSIEDQTKAGNAITATQKAINLVSEQRATLGAMQNRLEHKIANLDNTSENLSAAESRIRDVDIAKEMTNFTKNNILSQAATAMLAQANAAPQGVLSLLQ